MQKSKGVIICCKRVVCWSLIRFVLLAAVTAWVASQPDGIDAGALYMHFWAHQQPVVLGDVFHTIAGDAICEFGWSYICSFGGNKKNYCKTVIK